MKEALQELLNDIDRLRHEDIIERIQEIIDGECE